MNLPPEVQTLFRAVETILDENSPQGARVEAHEVCERFKSATPVDVCLQTGFLLFDQTESPIVRHFGLQLLQHCVSIRWDDLNELLLEELRQKALALLKQQGDRPLLLEEGYVKHALSCFVVELTKRLWPQAWPTLLSDVLDIAKCGEGHLEIVLMVLQRLAQDVLEFDTHLPLKRRCELKQVLARECQEGLVDFLRQTLLSHATRVEQLEQLDSAAVAGQLRVHQRLSQAVVETLTAYLEWVSFAPLFADDGLLLRVLCQLLLLPCLQRPAVECLVHIVQRKHAKVEERHALLVLFRAGPMKLFQQAASVTDYFFLKKLAELLTCLGTAQLSHLWNQDGKPCVEDKNFAAYLDVLLNILAHPSPYLQHLTLSVWHVFLEHEYIHSDATFRSRLRNLLQLIANALVKPAAPLDSASSKFSCISEDFADQKEFSLFFSVHRGQLMQTARLVTAQAPHDTLLFLVSCLQEMIATLGNQDGAGHKPTSPVVLRCDGLLCLTEAVMSVFAKMDPSQWPASQVCSQLISMVVQWDCKDGRLVMAQVGLLEAFYPFLQLLPNETETVLVKLLSVLVFRPSASSQQCIHAMQRRSGAAFVNLCDKQVALVMPYYQSLLNKVQQIWPRDELNNGERTNLIEGLVCVSRRLPSSDQQQSLLAQLLAPVTTQWQSSDIQQAIRSAEHFVTYVGLHGDATFANMCRAYRAQLFFCLNTFLAVLRRYETASDAESVKMADYPAVTQNSVSVICNPVWQFMEAVIPSACQLLATFCTLWNGNCHHLLSQEFSKAFEMPLVDRALLLGIDVNTDEFQEMVKETPVVWAQRSMSGIFDACLNLLGKCGQCLSTQFYKSDSVMSCVREAVLPMITSAVPTYRLRLLTRTLIRPFVLSCPPMLFEQALDPFLSGYFTLTGQRLQQEWSRMEQRQVGNAAETGEVDQLDLLDHEEVIEDAVVRGYAKDYLQAIESFTRPLEENAQENAEDGEDTINQQHRAMLRSHILQTQSLYQPLLMTMLNAMVGPDRLSSFRGVKIFSHLMPSFLSCSPMPDDMLAQVLNCILRAVQLYGQTPANFQGQVVLLAGLLEKFHATHSSTLVAVLTGTLPASPEEVAMVVQTVVERTSAEKKSRDVIKKLLAGLKGKATSHLFRLDIRMPQLPELQLPPSKGAPLPVDEMEHHDLGLARLCGESNGHLPDDDADFL